MVIIPHRGDVVWLDFEPQLGREIKKRRPAVTLSPYNYNTKTRLAIFAPITSQIKGYPFEIVINHEKITGAILCDQVRSMDFESRNVTKIFTLDKKTIDSVLSKLILLLE